MNIPNEFILKALSVEVLLHRNFVFILFTIISLSMLSVGSVWPKYYTSFSMILADERNILQPLMEGTAEATRTTDFVGNAREIILGEKIMDQILIDAGWLEVKRTEIEKEVIKEDIKKSIKIKAVGKNLIKIEYRTNDAMKAFITAKRMAELFIEEGERSKMNESQAAYDFIEKQVNEYLAKLIHVEEQLSEFRSNNPDARSGLDAEVSMRITRLTSDLEKTHLELRETEIRRNSLQEQLSGEAAITISQSKEGQYRGKIAELQARLETMRLDYKDTYPDIVRLKHQIEDLKGSLKDERVRRQQAKVVAQQSGSHYIDESIILNPLYQQLRSDESASQTKIATLNARMSEMKIMLENEYERARRIHGGEEVLAKLTRDYKVNQEIYQDLLKRKERARVSRNIDKENQGLTYKIQEPAKIPLIPTGVRFLHFIIAGLVLGLAAPIGLIYLMIQVDTRIRFSQIISNELKIPLLAEISIQSNKRDDYRTTLNLIFLLLGFLVVIGIYSYIGWLKYTGEL